MGSLEVVKGAIDGIVRNIEIFPADNKTTPENLGMEEYLTQRPFLLKHQVGVGHILVKSSRRILDGMDEAEQKIAGTIIRTHFTDKEIEDYGREKVRAR